MRLIDADKLKNDIAKWLNPKAYIEEPRMVEVDDIAVSTIMEIEEQPTAFYEERVLETLKKELDLADRERDRCSRENILQFDEAKGYARGISYAMEVVIKGRNLGGSSGRNKRAVCTSRRKRKLIACQPV